MRIFVCLIFDAGKSLWHRQFPDTLVDMGHEVVVAEGIGLTESWVLSAQRLWTQRKRSYLTTKILEQFEQEHRKKPFDLFFAYLFPFQFNAELFDEVKAFGVPTLSFFCDNLSHPEMASQFAPHATLNWVPEKAALEQFNKAGAAALYLPMAANPRYNYPVSIDETIKISFAGGKNPFRRELLGDAISEGMDVTIFGGGWIPDQISHHVLNSGTELYPVPKATMIQKASQWVGFKADAAQLLLKHGLYPRRAGRAYARRGEAHETLLEDHVSTTPLNLVQLNALYAKSSVSLGINDQFCATAIPPLYAYPKMREFEATMAGACYLTQETTETADLFEIGTEIECYSSAEELVEKARDLLGSPTRRRDMRNAARARAIGEHTWQHRFATLFARLNLRK